MMPFNLGNLNALRGMLYGGPRTPSFGMPTTPMPNSGPAPIRQLGAPGQPNPMFGPGQMGPEVYPMYNPGQMPARPMPYGAGQFPNLMALQSLGPQGTMMRSPMGY
jgi:hypothetical protein